jgi:hypothetical protein
METGTATGAAARLGRTQPQSKYPPAEPGALGSEPLKAA